MNTQKSGESHPITIGMIFILSSNVGKCKKWHGNSFSRDRD